MLRCAVVALLCGVTLTAAAAATPPSATLTQQRRLQQVASPSPSPSPSADGAYLVVTRKTTGEDVSLPLIVGMAVVAGVVVGAAIGILLSIRARKRKERNGVSLAAGAASESESRFRQRRIMHSGSASFERLPDNFVDPEMGPNRVDSGSGGVVRKVYDQGAYELNREFNRSPPVRVEVVDDDDGVPVVRINSPRLAAGTGNDWSAGGNREF
jgi:hypothetical protein